MARLHDPAVDGAFVAVGADGSLNRLPDARGAHGIRFEEPRDGMMVVVHFENPEGVAKYTGPYEVHDSGGRSVWWQRTGTTLDDLTLHPSIHINPPTGWHGFVINGEVTTV